MIETSNELIWYARYIHFIPPVWIEMAFTYMSGSA